MRALKDWLSAIVIVGAVVASLYAAWILAILTAIGALVFVVKTFIGLGRE